LTPTAGIVGSTATLSITSSGFYIDGAYNIAWCPNATFVPEKTIVLKKGEAPPQAMSVTDSFTVPEAKYGIYYVEFYRDSRPDEKPVVLQFNVKPRLEVIPPQAVPGAKVTVKGTGFPAGDDGSISYDGKTTDLKIETNDVGTFNAEFVVPDTIAGDHKFVANSAKLFTDSASATMKVVPGISIDPQKPDIGTDATVTGKGFAAKSVVQIKYDSTSVADSPTTDDNGIFSYTFKVPDSSNKTHKVTAEDGAGNSITLSLALETAPPSKPTPVSPKAERFGWLGGNEAITFSWTPVSDVSGVTYNIEVGENLTFFPLKPGMKKTGLTEPNCTLNINAGTYYWRVQAVDGAGNESEWTMSPYAFNVGFFSTWLLVVAGLVCLLIFILLLRAFFRRLREYY
jgi:hypothetical protein